MIFRINSLDKEITKENAKDIYYSKYFINKDSLKFYYDNFTEEELLKWNDEYLNKKLDICESLFNEEKTFETLGKHCRIFSRSCDIFTSNKNTYKRIINYLKKLYNEYGYFINYYFNDPFDREFDFGPSEYNRFKLIYLSNAFYSEREKEYFESHYHYYPEYKWSGLIHVLNMLGFKDLLDELFIKILIPILNNYHHQKYFNGKEIKYSRTKINDFHLVVLPKKYILEFNIDAPKELKEILEIE